MTVPADSARLARPTTTVRSPSAAATTRAAAVSWSAGTPATPSAGTSPLTTARTTAATSPGRYCSDAAA